MLPAPLPSLHSPLPSLPNHPLHVEPRHARSVLTGRSCMRALWPTALFDFVFVCVCVCVGGESKSLFLASEGSDFCGSAVRSPFPLRQINASTRQVAAPDESHPPLWRRPATTGNMFFPNSKLVATEWRTHRVALQRGNRFLHCTGALFIVEMANERYRGLQLCMLPCQLKYLTHLWIIYLNY